MTTSCLAKRDLWTITCIQTIHVMAACSIFEMCQKAVELGLKEIGFSEHVDFEPKDAGYGFFNYDRYLAEIENARRSFKNRLVIRKGVEIDYQRCFESDIKQWLKGKKLDFIIGSVHYLDHEIISRQMAIKKDLGEIYDSYFDEVGRSVQSGLFDVVGHFDLVRRYASNVKTDCREKAKAILSKIAERQMYLEMNSKGLREAFGDTSPSKRIVGDYLEIGGELVSVGSDAHSRTEIGMGIRETLDFLGSQNGNRIRLLFE
jgi:histidinol-phosphatase (PHP family)